MSEGAEIGQLHRFVQITHSLMATDDGSLIRFVAVRRPTATEEARLLAALVAGQDEVEAAAEELAEELSGLGGYRFRSLDPTDRAAIEAAVAAQFAVNRGAMS